MEAVMRLQSSKLCRMMLLLGVWLPGTSQEIMLRKTEHLNLVYYDKGHEYLTPHITRCFENALAFHRHLFEWTPTEPVLVFMSDFDDFGHGSATSSPRNNIEIGIEPFEFVYDTLPANERMNWMLNHELTHVATMDKGAGRDLFFRKVFLGKVAPTDENPLSMIYGYWCSPRLNAPRWYIEGIGAFLETWMAGGQGRALGGYDEMVFRTKTLEKAEIYDVVGLESEGTAVDFQVGANSYLYGTRFLNYLAATQGPEKVISWFKRTPGSEPGFAAQFKKLYGVPLEVGWRQWITYERQWQAQNLERIRQYPVTQDSPVTKEVVGSVSRSFYDPEKQVVYAAIRQAAQPAQVVSIKVKDGKITPLMEIVAPTLYSVASLAFDSKDHKLFFTTHNSKGWRSLNELDLTTGKTKQLAKNFRTGDLVVNPADQSIWGIQHHQGKSTIVRVQKPHKLWEKVLTLDYGRDLIDLDISPDGKVLSGTLIEISGEQKLVTVPMAALLMGEASFETHHDFGISPPANFTFAPDGRYMFGTSYHTGVSNVWRYDLSNKKMEALTNAESGFFRPISLSNSELLAYRYRANGFSLVRLPVETREDLNAIKYLGQEVVNNYPIVKTWNIGSPAKIDVDKVTTYKGVYRPGAMISLHSMYPVIEGYKDSVAGGFRLDFGDPMFRNGGNLTVAYSPDTKLERSEWWHAKVDLHKGPWKLALAQNATDFYDLFGPTKTSRKGNSASLSYHDYLIFDPPEELGYTLKVAHYGGLDTVPDAQNIKATFTEFSTLDARMTYKRTSKSLGGVEDEKGLEWKLVASGARVNHEVFPKVYGALDYGILLPWEHSSVWLRSAAGKSWGDRGNSFSKFYFGGFGNNYVDHGSIRRYRDYYSLPGLKLNEAGGNNFGKMTLEWALPPLRFRRAGSAQFYCNWARLALFTSQLVTDIGSDTYRHHVPSVGAQVDFNLVLFSNLPSTLSLGYANARYEGKSSKEVMASLKLLR